LKPKKPKADWEAIEREYRAGQLSVSEIARQHSISHTAVNKKAKAEGWTRNLVEAVRQVAEAKLVSDGVSAETSREIVETSAARVVAVVRSHRQDIQTAREEASALLAELRDARLHLDVIEDAIEASGERSEAKRRMRQAVSLGDRAATLRELSNSIHKIVSLERQAFAIDPKGTESQEPKTSKERVAEVEREVAEIVGAELSDGDPEPGAPSEDAGAGA
jgi:hypothetical protein